MVTIQTSFNFDPWRTDSLNGVQKESTSIPHSYLSHGTTFCSSSRDEVLLESESMGSFPQLPIMLISFILTPVQTLTHITESLSILLSPQRATLRKLSKDCLLSLHLINLIEYLSNLANAKWKPTREPKEMKRNVLVPRMAPKKWKPKMKSRNKTENKWLRDSKQRFLTDHSEGISTLGWRQQQREVKTSSWSLWETCRN